MAYTDFDLKSALRKFELVEEIDLDLFSGVVPIEPDPYLVNWLDEFGPVGDRDENGEGPK